MNIPNGGQASTPEPRRKLPINPSQEFLQKQAKRLAKQHPELQLAAAQHQLAQEYGCKHWADLMRLVEAVVCSLRDSLPLKT